MKAKYTAKDIAASANIFDSQHFEIRNQISVAAKDGKFFIWYYKQIPNEIRVRLTEDGYKVGATTFDRNEFLTKISW